MESKTNIRRMMAGNSIVVPDYQRAYSWEVKERGAQVRVFLEDLIDYIHCGSKTPYYFGHFLFERRSDSEYAVIDGQQRPFRFLFVQHSRFYVICVKSLSKNKSAMKMLLSAIVHIALQRLVMIIFCLETMLLT